MKITLELQVDEENLVESLAEYEEDEDEALEKSKMTLAEAKVALVEYIRTTVDSNLGYDRIAASLVSS